MKYIIANWKSNKTREEIEHWVDRFEQLLKAQPVGEQVAAIIAPPFPSLMFVSNRLLDRELHAQTFLAVQDISPFPAGSYTGAVSARNLDGFNVKYAIVGHSERRRYFHETHQEIANKVSQCLENGITPILCIDEEYVFDQAGAMTKDQLGKCIVAYEPLSAIGTGQNEPIDHVIEVRDRIKKVFGENVPILYGGSVTEENFQEYLDMCDGLLIGGASLDAVKFSKLLV